MTKIYLGKLGEFGGIEKEFITFKSKYEKLLKFVKELAKDFPDRDVFREALQEEAQKLLQEIGE